MMQDLKVSVIIPTYNRADFVVNAVHSVLAQTYKNLEVIVVDDCSKDDTVEKLTKISFNDDRLIIICHDTNKGAQFARNTGINKSTGQIIALLDSDDEWMPDKLMKQIELFNKKGSSLGVVYTGYIKKFYKNHGGSKQLYELRGNIYEQLLSDYGLGPNSIMAIRKDYLIEAGLFSKDIQACQEWDLCIRLSRLTNFDFVPEYLVHYNLHNEPTISKDCLKNANGYLQVIQRNKQEIINKCGKSILGKHYKIAGLKFIEAKRFRTAKILFFNSITNKYLNFKLLIYLVVSHLGEKQFYKIRHVWKLYNYSLTKFISRLFRKSHTNFIFW